ncbi:hypothetical protein E2C01_094779 [Portunus trituberculatus]|uniref:Uncharacterized protein n=1 Tax=Portunus trituberculatus TaxID=210409 RepID=A0A5B7JX22_PORTR|nr:hypothetical protein [Portunus trituberculatus]
MRVKQTQAAPASNVSYASTVRAPPKMCTVAIQTDLLLDPSTTTDSLSTSASSSAETTSTSTKTSTPITYSAPYLSAISRTPSKGEKTDKSNKSNLTKLERQRPSHVVAAPAPSRKGSHARSLSTSSGELTNDELMDVTTCKGRERSPGSTSERKRTKKNRRHHNSYAIMFKVLQWNCRSKYSE